MKRFQVRQCGRTRLGSIASNGVGESAVHEDTFADSKEITAAAHPPLAQSGLLKSVQIGINGPDEFRKDTLFRFGLQPTGSTISRATMGNVSFIFSNNVASGGEDVVIRFVEGRAEATYHNDIGVVEVTVDGQVQTISECIREILKRPSGGQV